MAPPLGLTLCHVGMQLALPGQDDRGEGLVDLDDVHVLEAQLGLLEHEAGGGDGGGEHDDGVVGGHGEGVEAGPGPQPQGFGALLAHDENGGRPVRDLRRRARRDHAVFGEGGDQGAQFLDARVAAHPLVDVEGGVPVGARRAQGHELVGEAPLVLGPRGPAVGLQGEGVHLVTPDVPAPGDLLGREALVDELVAGVDGGPVGLAGPGVGGGADGHPAHRLDPGRR